MDVQIGALRHLIKKSSQSNRTLLPCLFKGTRGARFGVGAHRLPGLCIDSLQRQEQCAKQKQSKCERLTTVVARHYDSPLRCEDMQKLCSTSVWYRLALAAGLFSSGIAALPASAQQWLQSIPQFPLASSNLTIRQHAEMLKRFTVAGKCGVFVGQQDGSFEAC